MTIKHQSRPLSAPLNKLKSKPLKVLSRPQTSLLEYQQTQNEEKAIEIPTINLHDNTINLVANAPILDFRIEKWTDYCLEISDAFSNLNFYEPSPCISRAITPIDGRASVMSSRTIPNAYDLVEKESKRALKVHQEKLAKVKAFRAALKKRLCQRSLVQKEAMREVLDYYYDVSFDRSNKVNATLKRAVKTNAAIPIKIPKALSSESLELSDFPIQAERPYFVFPEEKNAASHFHRKYFFEDHENAPEIPLPTRIEVAEKKLRTHYRAGHLEEIKRNEFGHVYSNIRRHFAEIERERVKGKKRVNAQTSASADIAQRGNIYDNLVGNRHVFVERFSKRFLKEKKPTANPFLQEELHYDDKDHSIAHRGGYSTIPTTSTPSNALNKRQVSISYHDLPDINLMFDRRRRSSHDERIVAKDRTFLIDVEETKRKLLSQEDTDGDFQITVHDQGPKSFTIGTADSHGFKKFELRGHYMISNLLQELQLASEHNRRHIVLHEDRLSENPVDRLTRLIKFHFWDGLTRRIDAEGLERICEDPKNRSVDQQNRIYIPYHDNMAFDYYTQISIERTHLRLNVTRLPETITPVYVKSINCHPGLLSLGLRTEWDATFNKNVIRGIPFVVPGGRFNEMYGWDSYFEALGLLIDGRVELARGMAENFLYQIEHYGKILNANRTYYLTRSQPPFLTDMIIQCLSKMRLKIEWTNKRCKLWLLQGLRGCLKELLSVWMTAPRLDTDIGLSKYYTDGYGMPPETEADHFDHVMKPFADKHGVELEKFKEMYDNGEIIEPDLDDYFIHDRAVRESGHDTTYRFDRICAHLATIDLNSLVYKYESDIYSLLTENFDKTIKLHVRKGKDNINLESFKFWHHKLLEKGVSKMIGNHGGWESSWARGIKIYDEILDLEYEDDITPKPQISGALASFEEISDCDYFIVFLHADIFAQMASRTKDLVTQYLWSPSRNLFFDYNCFTKEQCVYESVTCLWALWSGLASADQAKLMVPVALKLFEVTGGLVSGTEHSRGRVGIDRPVRQWDYPYGWAPHQMLAWVGLEKYGYISDSRRVAYRWLYTLTTSFFDFNGVVPEKFDVVGMTHKVDAEYGNVGVDFKYVVKEGFGWMNASYEMGLTFMTKNMRRALGTLTRPDQMNLDD